MSDPSFADALSDSEVRIWINACNHEPARQALRQLLAYRIRGVSVPLADPIPEAPADEEVGGPDVGLARDEWLAAASSPQIERWALKWADVLLDALRRSTKTDKPGVREAAAETSPEVKSLCELHEVLLSANRARHVAWYKLSPFIEKVLDAAIALEKAQRALSASPLPPSTNKTEPYPLPNTLRELC